MGDGTGPGPVDYPLRTDTVLRRAVAPTSTACSAIHLRLMSARCADPAFTSIGMASILIWHQPTGPGMAPLGLRLPVRLLLQRVEISVAAIAGNSTPGLQPRKPTIVLPANIARDTMPVSFVRQLALAVLEGLKQLLEFSPDIRDL